MSEKRRKAKELSENIIVEHLEKIAKLQRDGKKLAAGMAVYPINVLKVIALRDAIDEQKPVDFTGVTTEKLQEAVNRFKVVSGA